MRMSPGSRWGSRSAMVSSTTAAGTMSQTARGLSSFLTRSTKELAPTARSLTSSATAWGDLSKTTQLCPFLISRRTMLAPMRPSPIIPNCIDSPSETRIRFKVSFVRSTPTSSDLLHPETLRLRYDAFNGITADRFTVEQSQARNDNILHSVNNRPQNLVGHNFVGIPCQAFFQRSPPRNPKFGIDVDNVYSGSDCFPKVFILGPRPAV